MNRKLKNEELERLTLDGYKSSEKTPVVLVLDNVRSLNNVGAIFRTADAFLLAGIYLCGITPRPPHREIQKTALGATDSVDWEYWSDTTSAVKNLKEKGYAIISVEQTTDSHSLESYQPPDQPLALIFGHEVKGVDEEAVELSDACLEIPQYGTKHSLNISVSVGVVVWDLFQKVNLSRSKRPKHGNTE